MITKQGVSLRQVARTLKYAVSTLHEGREAGHFEALEDGSYDVAAVAAGLLANSSPRADRREMLERLAAGSDASIRQRPETQRFDARTEAAIEASTKLSRAPDVMEAIDLLARLAFAKTAAFHAICPLLDPVGAVSVFKDAIVSMLDLRIEQIEQGADDETETNDDPNDDLVTAVAAAACAKSGSRNGRRGPFYYRRG
jgi:hypothetical protein